MVVGIAINMADFLKKAGED